MQATRTSPNVSKASNNNHHWVAISAPNTLAQSRTMHQQAAKFQSRPINASAADLAPCSECESALRIYRRPMGGNYPRDSPGRCLVRPRSARPPLVDGPWRRTAAPGDIPLPTTTRSIEKQEEKQHCSCVITSYVQSYHGRSFPQWHQEQSNLPTCL